MASSITTTPLTPHTYRPLPRAAQVVLLAAVLALTPGCVTAVSLGVGLVGGVVDRADVDELEERLVGADLSLADRELGERIDTLDDENSTRAWVEYKARNDPLGKDRYVIEVKKTKIIAVSRVEKTPDAKFDIPRALALESKVKGKHISECAPLLEMGKPLVTVRRQSTGFLSQLFEGDVVKIGDPYYCILKFDANDNCANVEFHSVGASTTDRPFES